MVLGGEKWMAVCGGCGGGGRVVGGNRWSLSLAGDACWSATTPGGRSPVRERDSRERGSCGRERER